MICKHRQLKVTFCAHYSSYISVLFSSNFSFASLLLLTQMKNIKRSDNRFSVTLRNLESKQVFIFAIMHTEETEQKKIKTQVAQEYTTCCISNKKDFALGWSVFELFFKFFRGSYKNSLSYEILTHKKFEASIWSSLVPSSGLKIEKWAKKCYFSKTFNKISKLIFLKRVDVKMLR